MQRDEIAEQIVALAGSVSSEKAARMRELVMEARIEGVDRLFHVVDALRHSHLDEVKRLDNLTARIDALERGRLSAPYGKIPAHAWEDATTNTGEGRAEAARGSGNVTGPSTQPVNARPTGVREGVSAVDEGSAASRQAAPFPDPIPAWVPSVEEIQQFIDDGREGDLRALIASRAPAQPSVEEMAERIYDANAAFYATKPLYVWADAEGRRKDYFRVLARAALSATKEARND